MLQIIQMMSKDYSMEEIEKQLQQTKSKSKDNDTITIVYSNGITDIFQVENGIVKHIK
jgi:hypothetical protein